MKKLPDTTGTPPDESPAAPDDANQRRAFLKKSANLAITAPAVSLLLAASLKPETAEAKLYSAEGAPWIP